MTLYTIGHSNKSIEEFLSELKSREIHLVVDVRSIPYSRFSPQFNREPLIKVLGKNGIAYKHIPELGGKIDQSVNYAVVAKDIVVQQYLAYVVKQNFDVNLVLMCSEKHPAMCHRCLMLGRELDNKGIRVNHILGDKTLTQNDVEERMLHVFSKLANLDAVYEHMEVLARAHKPLPRQFKDN